MEHFVFVVLPRIGMLNNLLDFVIRILVILLILVMIKAGLVYINKH